MSPGMISRATIMSINSDEKPFNFNIVPKTRTIGRLIIKEVSSVLRLSFVSLKSMMSIISCVFIVLIKSSLAKMLAGEYKKYYEKAMSEAMFLSISTYSGADNCLIYFTKPMRIGSLFEDVTELYIVFLSWYS